MKFITAILGSFLVGSLAIQLTLPKFEETVHALGIDEGITWFPFIQWGSYFMLFISGFYFTNLLGMWLINRKIWGKIRQQLRKITVASK